MGKYNQNLEFNENLSTAVENALNRSGNGKTKCTPECDFEYDIRSKLGIGNLDLIENFTKSCKKNPCKNKSCDCNYYLHCGCEYPKKGPWKNTPVKHHPDILSKKNCLGPAGRLIAEIKMLDACTMKNLFDANINNFETPTGRYFFDNESSTTLHAPFQNLNNNIPVFTHLAEGQIWMDIIRLLSADVYFKTIDEKPNELYLILGLKPNTNQLPAENMLHHSFKFFDKNHGQYLYHGWDTVNSKTSTGSTFRADVKSFEYNFVEITANKKSALLVKIVPK